MSTTGDMCVTVNDIDWQVFYTYYPGEMQIIDKLPEDCHPGSPAEVDITGLYVGDDEMFDLVEVITEDVVEEIADKVLEFAK